MDGALTIDGGSIGGSGKDSRHRLGVAHTYEANEPPASQSRCSKERIEPLTTYDIANGQVRSLDFVPSGEGVVVIGSACFGVVSSPESAGGIEETCVCGGKKVVRTEIERP